MQQPTCPEAFLCPITHQIMSEPVVDPEGNSYERAAIGEWLSRKGTSPVTRSPLDSRDLAPNRALQHAIEQHTRAAAGGAAATPAPIPQAASHADVAADRGVQITAASTSGADGQATLMLTLQPPAGLARTPTDVCCVVDVSGSMGAEATMKGEGGSTETHGLSLLDVVKHAVTTIISVLGPQDRLSLVAYSSGARVVFDLLVMDDAGKSQAKLELAGLRTGGQTNLWDGLHSGLEILRRGCEGGGSRLSAVLLLTDGQPNICPPRGHLPMLKRYKDQNVRLSATISTFGFGYRLDSELLRELASEGDGMYAFIPDSGFVGTVFVNALSNLLVTMAKNVKLSLEAVDGATFVPGIPGGLAHQETSWGIQVDVGSLQYGQARHCCVNVNMPSGYVPGTPLIQATLEFETRHDAVPIKASIAVGHEPGTDTAAEVAVQSIRLSIVDQISQAVALATRQGGVGPDSQAIVAALVAEIQATGLQDQHSKGMLEDLDGQATMALSSAEYYDRWGVHYLPSLVRAHQLEQCNNFKDPGVQNYGGELFCRLRDQADDLFCKLPPPKPSVPPARGGYGTPSHTAAAVSRPPVDMSMYNNRSNPCFAGECSVHMADGTRKPVASIMKGDEVRAPNNNVAKVVCVVKTRCAGGKTELVELPGSLLVTPWHPVRMQVQGNKASWTFPSSLATAQIRSCPAVYSFVLDSAHILTINDVQCVGLGHDIKGDPVVSHPFFGTQAVIEELRRMRGWADGYVNLEPGCLIKDSASGVACSFAPEIID